MKKFLLLLTIILFLFSCTKKDLVNKETETTLYIKHSLLTVTAVQFMPSNLVEVNFTFKNPVEEPIVINWETIDSKGVVLHHISNVANTTKHTSSFRVSQRARITSLTILSIRNLYY